MYHWHVNSTTDRTLPPLLLLHGWMGSCQDYLAIIDRLKLDFYCIAIDLPGHGQTQVINDDRGYDFVTTARGIIELLDRLKIDRTAIAGYSFGGRLALYLALEFPDRFDRVMLESTSPGLATAADRQARIISDLQIIDRLTNNDLTSFAIEWYRQSIFTGIDREPNFSELIERRINSNRSLNLAKSLQYAGLGMQPYLGDRLKAHRQPISLIVGELDLKFVQIGRDLARECPNIDLQIVANCSHNIHFQQPQTWIDIYLDPVYDRT
jgi:2-succinyl-6-hydroxy-2,4-cyclohexadiene-1-carboxylate synthase